MSLSTLPIRAAVTLSLLAVLAACQTQGPQVSSEAASGVDFATFSSFDFHDPLSTDRAGYHTLTTQHLKDAVERELLARGIRHVTTNPDLLVNFAVTTRETISQGTSPRFGVSYGGWSGGGMGMGVGVSTGGGVQTATEGTLTIDLVSRETNRIVWTGSVAGRLPRDAASRSQSIIDAAVKAILERYPAPHQATP